jgi:FeS assembly SUF system regulator
VLATLAQQPERLRTATALAETTRIAAPTVSKLLKQLHRAGLLTSTRGLHGGYQLARPPSQITVAAILDALEGPFALTECSAGHGHCDIEHNCRVGGVWQRLNVAIRRSLSAVTLAELAGLDPVQPRLPTVEHEIRQAARSNH